MFVQTLKILLLKKILGIIKVYYQSLYIKVIKFNIKQYIKVIKYNENINIKLKL